MDTNKPPLDDIIQGHLVMFLRISILPISVVAIFEGNWSGFFISIAALVLMFMPEFIERSYKVKLPIEYSLFTALFLYASFILGEFGGAYERFWWWDAALHVGSAFVLALLGFLALYFFKAQRKIDVSPSLFAFFVFSVGMSFGGVWEIFEFTVDNLFGLNMQRTGLEDTMGDLIVDAFGSLVVALGARQYLINGERGGPISRFIGKSIDAFAKDNPKIAKRLDR